MDNDSHKIWNTFTKFVLWGTIIVVLILVLMAIFLTCKSVNEFSIYFRESKVLKKEWLWMPESAKRYISLGLGLIP